jgi:hypothetical protein
MSPWVKRYIRLKEYEPNSVTFGDPNADYPADSTLERRTYEVRADADGFICNGDPVSGEDGSLVLLGDSVPECALIDAPGRLSSLLERGLQERGLRVRVLNGGYSGMSTLHALNIFLNKLPPRRPLAVIYMSGIVDDRICYRPDSFWSAHPELDPLVNDETREDDADNVVFHTERVQAMLRLLDQAADATGLPLWIATTPFQTDPDCEFLKRSSITPDGFGHFNRDLRLLNAQKLEIFHRRPVFDIASAIEEPTTALYDLYHFNPDGARRAAEAFFREGFADQVAAAVAERRTPLSSRVLGQAAVAN